MYTHTHVYTVVGCVPQATALVDQFRYRKQTVDGLIQHTVV